MNISLLQIILLLSIIVLFYMVIDAGRRNRLRIFHVIVFSFGLLAIGLVAFKPDLLSQLWNLVGVEKGSDFIVYMSIIWLGVIVFSLLQYTLNQQQELTRFTTRQALRDYKKTKNEEPTILSSEYASYLFLIRAYNEGPMIASVIEEIIAAGFMNIVICNDGSTDSTEEIIENLQQQYAHVRIILLSHIINRWPGAANKTLFAFAKNNMKHLWCTWAVSYDADGQMDINDMKIFMPTAQTNTYDIIFGSRFVQWGQTTNLPLIRKIILQGGRIVTYIFNGLWLTDVSTGYRLYNQKAIDSIIITSDRFSYQNDIIESVRRSKLSFTEIPVHIKYTDYSLSKGQSNMSAIKILIRLIYSSLFQR